MVGEELDELSREGARRMLMQALDWEDWLCIQRSIELATNDACGDGGNLCLLFIHPRAPNLISLRSAGTMSA